MKQICRASGTEFEISEEDLAFYHKVSPKIGGKVYEIPPPTLCPDCRFRRRLCFRNEMNLFRRKCDLSGRDIITFYPETVPFPVLENSEWWSDHWDAKTFARDFDFSRTFFENFSELFKTVPKMALIQQGENENSAYLNGASYNKNCYLIFTSSRNEDCMYGKAVNFCKDSLDNCFVSGCELCYESINSENCYNCLYIQDTFNCSDSVFLKNCIGCRYCIGCVNLRNKEYHIFNTPCTKAEFEIALKELSSFSGVQKWQKLFQEKQLLSPRRFMEGISNENVIGNYIRHSQNVTDCFDCSNIRDCKFCTNIHFLSDSYDVDYFGIAETNDLLYECDGVGLGAHHLLFSKIIWGGSSDCMYCYECFKSQDCFGCSGLKSAQYCILNKQYTKEEYEALVPKIIEHMKQTPLNPPLSGGGKQSGEWGEFFPIELSPFAYNETVAQEYFPMSKEEVLAKGWKWRDEIVEMPKVSKVIPASRLPDSIDDIPDDILNWAIECEESGKPFKIQKAELEFYRKMRLPIPHFHPDVRHAHRMAKRNPRKLWERNCDKCGVPIQTTYAPERPEKVFCERCYQESVY